MILRSGRALRGNGPFPVVVPHWLRREIHASPTGFEGKSTRPPLASKGNPRHGGARSSDADMVGRSQRPCPSLTWSAGRARRWLSPSPTAGKRSDGRTTSWRRTLPARLSSMSWARGFAAVSNGNGPLLLLPTCNNLARWQQQCLHAYGQVRSRVCSGSVRVLTPARARLAATGGSQAP